MNPFAAIKSVLFAEKLFAAAGLNFSAIVKDGNADALKDALEKAKADGAAASVENASSVVQAALDSALAENTALAGKHSAFAKAVADAGVKIADGADAEAVKAAIEARSAAKAAEIVAATGTAPLAENVTADAAGNKAAKAPALTGRDRTIAAFKASAAAKAAK